MADISKITLPSGTTYNIKDAEAREAIAGGVTYIGVSTTAITDGGSQKPTINGAAVTPKNGNLAIYDSGEFIFTGTYGDGGTWSEFGDMSNLGDMAYVDKGYAKSFTPAGTVSQPTFTGTGVRLETAPFPIVSSTSFTGDSLTSTGSISVNNYSITSSEQMTFEVESRAPSTGETANYTPAGTVSAPTISIGTAGSTTTIKNPTSVTVAKTVVTQAPSDTSHPSNPLTYASVSNETLILNQIGYTTGASITTSNVTVKNGDASYTASAPTFTGTGRILEINDVPRYTLMAIPTTKDVSVTGTPTGSVGLTTTNITRIVSPASSGTTTYTPSGTVSQPTFTGTAIYNLEVDPNQHL